MKLLLSTLALAVAAAALPAEATTNSVTSETTTTASSHSTVLVTSTTTAAQATLTGAFTIPNAGIYEVTSVSGYALVAGHTLVPGGAGALVGGVVVSDASQGVVADGQTVALATYTNTAVSSTAPASTMSTTTATSGTASAATAATSSKTGMAVPTRAPFMGMAALGAAAMGLMVL